MPSTRPWEEIRAQREREQPTTPEAREQAMRDLLNETVDYWSNLKLAGLHEIAEHYAISRQLAAKWSQRGDFPAPLAELAQGRVWNLDEVLEWGDRHDRKAGAGARPH